MFTLHSGDVRAILPTLPDNSVQCVVTSPPYWGLRDYGVSGQIGLEDTPEEFIAVMVSIFAQIRRILKPDGTLWMNLGDSYSSGNRSTLKPKDMVGIPWRVALALQADGWYLRQDIIWHKPNPMPESVTDRCTKAHEYLFLLTKSERYYFDSAAIQEPASGTAHARAPKSPAGWDTSTGDDGHGNFHKNGRDSWKGSQFHTGKTAKHQLDRSSTNRAPGVTPKAAASGQSGSRANPSFSAAVVDLVDTRNKRSVWTIPSAPYSEAHFATFPPDLVKPCILAGSRPGDLIFDPFLGSGTTAQVALELGRHAAGIELNPDYHPLIQARTNTTPGLPLH